MSTDGNAMREARAFLQTTGRSTLVTALDAIHDVAETAQHAAEIGDHEAAEVLREIDDNADRENYGLEPLPASPAIVLAWAQSSSFGG